ncbi:MAG TPA: RNA-binding protein [Acidilobales archaeon]|nr:RNA-binding protein [Acidilobales archaeon]
MKSRISEIKDKYVVPGESICVIEEFMPGIGTYEVKGEVRAALVGKVDLDLNIRTANVRPKVKEPILPCRGVIAYGIVTLIREEYALLRLIGDINGNKYTTPFTAILHISQASEKFIKDLFEILRVGDIVKVKVLNDTVPYNVTIKEAKLGVILAFCGKCGAQLKYEGTEMLKCPMCGNVEKRKLSIDYGKLKGLIRWLR